MSYPDEQNLVSLADAKQWLLISDTTSDTLLQQIIKTVSAEIMVLLNRPYLFSRTVIESFSGGDWVEIVPTLYPVTAVISLMINGMPISAVSSAYGVGYKFNSNAIRLAGYTYDWGIDNISLIYTGGIQPEGIEHLALKQVCLEIINFKWKRRPHPDLKTQNLGNQITASYSQDDFPAEVWTIIRKLINVVPTESIVPYP